jgi:hypothetical protein
VFLQRYTHNSSLSSEAGAPTLIFPFPFVFIAVDCRPIDLFLGGKETRTLEQDSATTFSGTIDDTGQHYKTIDSSEGGRGTQPHSILLKVLNLIIHTISLRKESTISEILPCLEVAGHWLFNCLILPAAL